MFQQIDLSGNEFAYFVDLIRCYGDDRCNVVTVGNLVVIGIAFGSHIDDLRSRYRDFVFVYSVVFQKIAYDFVLFVDCVIDTCHVIAYLLEYQRPYYTVGFHFAFGKAFDGNDAVAVFYGNDTVAEQTAHDDKADADAETREGFVECFHHACF